jgi:hypothetical protein
VRSCLRGGAARICVYVARCAGRGSLRSGRGRRRGRLAPCRGPLEGARGGGKLAIIGDRQGPVRAPGRSYGPHGRSLGERPRRSAPPPPAPYLGCRDWGRSGRELHRCTATRMATIEAAPLSCPLREHPQASPAMSRLGPRCMGPRRRGGWRGASARGRRGGSGARTAHRNTMTSGSYPNITKSSKQYRILRFKLDHDDQRVSLQAVGGAC